MKLNEKQINIIIDNLFDQDDLDWMERSFDELRASDVEIEPESDIPGWWQMYVNGREFTQLNFVAYPEVLEEVKKAL